MRIETEIERMVREEFEETQRRRHERWSIEDAQRYQTAFGIGFVLGCVMATGFTILFFHFFILP